MNLLCERLHLIFSLYTLNIGLDFVIIMYFEEGVELAAQAIAFCTGMITFL